MSPVQLPRLLQDVNDDLFGIDGFLVFLYLLVIGATYCSNELSCPVLWSLNRMWADKMTCLTSGDGLKASSCRRLRMKVSQRPALQQHRHGGPSSKSELLFQLLALACTCVSTRSRSRRMMRVKVLSKDIGSEQPCLTMVSPSWKFNVSHPFRSLSGDRSPMSRRNGIVLHFLVVHGLCNK